LFSSPEPGADMKRAKRKIDAPLNAWFWQT